jgi:hypothetical protein
LLLQEVQWKFHHPLLWRVLGLQVLIFFKIAGKSISVWIHSFKTDSPRNVRIPLTTQMEEYLAIYLECHPHVRSYQRGDASEAFAKIHHLATPLGTPYRINYVYDGTSHDYSPNFVGTLYDGKLLIAEAGLENEKRKGESTAKAEAAHSLSQLKGGVYWIGTEKNLPLSRYWNLVFLHSRRDVFKNYKNIAPVILDHWPWGHFHTVRDFLQLLESWWSESEIEAAVWKIVGDAAADGRLLVDLTEVELSLTTPLALLEPGSPPILPDSLPSSLEEDEQERGQPAPSDG